MKVKTLEIQINNNYVLHLALENGEKQTLTWKVFFFIDIYLNVWQYI